MVAANGRRIQPVDATDCWPTARKSPSAAMAESRSSETSKITGRFSSISTAQAFVYFFFW
jgi:hypothetical protein